MSTDAYWKELYDNASASEYYEERLKDAHIRLTAVEEQLAAIRKAAERVKDSDVVLVWQELTELVTLALSDAEEEK